jgi:SPASM domain peptide maturase of grasp-with-spasm system
MRFRVGKFQKQLTGRFLKMKMKNSNQYFVLSSSCKIVSGAKRFTIIDYQRGNLYFISKEYFFLLEKMNRKQLFFIEDALYDKESRKNFSSFLETMLSYEVGFLTESLELFPERSNEVFDTDLISLIDVIIEVDPISFDKKLFKSLCSDLKDLSCKDFQIRLFSIFDLKLIGQIVKVIDTTCANYIEIHCDYFEDSNLQKQLYRFIENNPLVSNIYLYGASNPEKVTVSNDVPGHPPIILGHIYYINYPFNNGNCCGIINMETLTYSNINTHNRLHKRNGCLDRKITIDKEGNIKNCPSMKKNYGNIRNISIKEVIETEDFQKLWFINKDQISVCKVCEYRYNCTDCRAFLVDQDNLYSKPLKCGYNPFTGKWEDWSKNSLKNKEVQKIT